MKVALLTLTRGTVSGGYRKYLDRLVPLLREQPEVERIDLFVPPKMAAPGLTAWPQNDDMRGFRELKRMVSDLRPDVIFIPTATLLRVDRLPAVVMVHNMEPLEVPFNGNALKDAAKNVLRATAARYACWRSDRVIAVSHHVRNWLHAHWDVPADKIGVINPGVDDPLPMNLTVPAALEPFAGTRFLFTAGSIRPARGLEDVIRALAKVPEDVRLVIAGTVDRGAEPYREKMGRLARECGVESRILWAGHLDRTGMSWCFRNAAFFVMTSRAEACPNIVLEAMAEAAPTVSTDHQPMPELLGDAALYYRERDAVHLAERLNEALAAPAGSWTAMGQRARARTSAYNWANTARETVAELQLAIDRCASFT
ncbi:MAG TPA: glycosyltransferase [Thermoanaerobaculia bacterium]|nr:glycosyltransferase [Thermoanaerobaculia bacterium]